MDYLDISIIPPNEIEMEDIEARIEDLYMSAFRAIFKVDPIYTWQEDKDKSKIIITSIYPEKLDAPLKKPHILFHDIAYSMNYDLTFKRNLDGLFFDDVGYNHNNAKMNIVPYGITISVFAGKSESRNLANRIVNYFTVYDEVFNQLNLNVANLSKAATQATSKYPEKLFETTLRISGHTEWISNCIINDKAKTKYILEHIETDVNVD